ncbi:YqhR family membrane protein [Heyndrickxia sp. NPDC080065]|uniref:YqhR family membrane protein n=1 Tax=Heyndrickxia sp. NPDC080065 TaxID=3390568 RepID=UPI003CFF1506
MLEMNEEYPYQRSSFILLVILTGFIGGVIWSLLGYLFYYFNFSTIEPNIILEPFTVGTWRDSWIGIILSILLYGILSIGAALVYYGLLKKVQTMWMGIGYGLIIFLIVFFILNPIFPSMKPFFRIDLNTIIASACVYALYGLFVGYSISYEHNEFKQFKEQQKKQ